MLSKELFDNAGKMFVHCEFGQSCIIGSRAVADVLPTCPNATATSLWGGPMMGMPSLGLLKLFVALESRRDVFINWVTWWHSS
jgi:hypothetical protein